MGRRARRQRAGEAKRRVDPPVGVAVCAGLGGGRDPSSRGGLGVGRLVRGHRVPARGAPGLAGAAADLPRPGRRVRARRPGRPGHRGEPAAPPAGQARVRAPFHGRARPPARPAGRGGHRGRLRPVRPGRPRRREAVPGRAVPDRARRHRDRARRRGRRAAGVDREPAARRAAGDVSFPAGLGHHPAAGTGPARDAPHLRHRRARRGVPVHLPRPARTRPGLGRRPGRGVLRLRPGQPGPGALGPLRPRPAQPQRDRARPQRLRQVVPGQARTAAQPLPRHRRRRHRPRGRVLPPRRRRRRHHRAPRRPRGPAQPLRPAHHHRPRRAPHRTARRLVRRSLFLHTVLAVLVGTEIATAARASLDRAIAATYRAAGITGDPRTWTRPAPTLRDLRDHLADAGRPRASRPDPAHTDARRRHRSPNSPPRRHRTAARLDAGAPAAAAAARSRGPGR